MVRRGIRYEEILTDIVVSYLRDKCVRFGWQIPALEGRIDFVGIRKSYEVIVIETKASNWKNALLQANRYQLCSDKAYIAVPPNIAKKANEHSKVFRKRGIGLMCVDDSIEIMIGARKTNLFVPQFRQYLLQVTKERQKRAVEAVEELVERHLSSNDSDSFQPMALEEQNKAMYCEEASGIR
ncbi:MAG: hypothetical protein R6V83_03690 [Candidatus Thorarchaeota archaeon]